MPSCRCIWLSNVQCRAGPGQLADWEIGRTLGHRRAGAARGPDAELHALCRLQAAGCRKGIKKRKFCLMLTSAFVIGWPEATGSIMIHRAFMIYVFDSATLGPRRPPSFPSFHLASTMLLQRTGSLALLRQPYAPTHPPINFPQFICFVGARGWPRLPSIPDSRPLIGFYASDFARMI